MDRNSVDLIIPGQYAGVPFKSALTVKISEAGEKDLFRSLLRLSFGVAEMADEDKKKKLDEALAKVAEQLNGETGVTMSETLPIVQATHFAFSLLA